MNSKKMAYVKLMMTKDEWDKKTKREIYKVAREESKLAIMETKR